jgi:hypothetical protein
VGIAELLDQFSEAICQPPATLWSAFARSLGEQGAHGRTALAWRWALTGACPSPVTLSQLLGRPPSSGELIAEAKADAEVVTAGADPGGQVMQARLVLRWLAGDIDTLPLWNGGPENSPMADGAPFLRSFPEIDEVHSWAMLAQWHAPGPAAVGRVNARAVSGWARGVAQLLDWVCGVTTEGPVAGLPMAVRRPSLYQVSLDVRHAMATLHHARATGDWAVAGRMAAIMDTFAWLAGWNEDPPVDRHGHIPADDCAERDAPCGCDAGGYCLQANCPACWRVQCVYGFGQEGVS